MRKISEPTQESHNTSYGLNPKGSKNELVVIAI